MRFVVLFLVLICGVANAQTARKPTTTQPQIDLPFDPLHLNSVKLTGDIGKDAQAVWQQVVTASDADLTYASKMAAVANTSSSAIRKQCWDGILAANQQANGAGVKDANGAVIPKPDAHLFTDVESLAEVIDNLSPQGQLYTSCAGAAQLAKANVIQFISAAVAGVAGIAKLAPIPGL